MGRPSCKHSLLRALKLWWLYLSLLVVIIFETDVEDKDNPDVAKTIDAL